MSYKIIGITGRKYNGKDTIANYLRDSETLINLLSQILSKKHVELYSDSMMNNYTDL